MVRWMRLALAACLLLVGCRFHALDGEVAQLRALGRISGEVHVEGAGGPITVALLQLPLRPWDPVRLLDTAVLERPGPFRFVVGRGRYRVVAFEDANRDDRVSDGERSEATGILQIGQRDFRDDVELRIVGVTAVPVMNDRVVDDRRYVVGALGRLDETRFSPRTGEESAWRPLDMIARHRPGLYHLERYDPTRIPVIFVHGLGGYGRQFESLIEGLDRERFQPWLFIYPSGLRVQRSAELLHAVIRQTRVDLGTEHLCVVAHSVGGVVTRRAMTLHQAEYDEPLIRGLTTVATPFGGLGSAAVGVRMAPEVVPAWYDLVPNEGFIRALFDEPLPSRMPNTLLFSYREGAASDGVVPIHSQLREAAQAEATTVRGVEASHTEVLDAPVTRRFVRSSLARCAENRPPGRPVVPVVDHESARLSSAR